MPYRHYSDHAVQQALAILDANKGDLHRTHRATGIAIKTLRRWLTLHRPPLTSGASLSQPAGRKSNRQACSQASSPISPSFSPDLVADLDQLQAHLVAEAAHLLATLRPAIAEASLSERTLALVRILDRLYKLAYQVTPTDDPADLPTLQFITPDPPPTAEASD